MDKLLLSTCLHCVLHGLDNYYYITIRIIGGVLLVTGQSVGRSVRPRKTCPIDSCITRGPTMLKFDIDAGPTRYRRLYIFRSSGQSHGDL